MKKLFFTLSAFLAVAPFFSAYANSITGSIGNANASYDLNDSDAFAYYGNTSAPLFQIVTGTPSTDLTNLADFTVLTAVAAVGETATSIQASGGSGNTVAVTYTNGTTPPQSSASNSKVFYYAPSSHTTSGISGIGFSLTTTLFAPTETFQFVLENYDAASDLTATLNDADSTSFSLTDAVLPQLWSGETASGSGEGNTDGLLTLTVSGAVGQTLTFTDVTDFSGISDTSNANVGIEAVMVSAVPEPATYGFMGMGGLLLVWQLRRKNVQRWI